MMEALAFFCFGVTAGALGVLAYIFQRWMETMQEYIDALNTLVSMNQAKDAQISSLTSQVASLTPGADAQAALSNAQAYIASQQPATSTPAAASSAS